MLRLAIQVPQRYQAKVLYALNCLSQRVGLPILISVGRDPAADMYYGELEADACQDNSSIRVPFTAEWYEKKSLPSELRTALLTLVNNIKLGCMSSEKLNFDLPGAIFRFLNLYDEIEVAKESLDRRGVFLTTDLPEWRKSLAAVPVVDLLAEYVRNLLLRRKPSLAALVVPFWPSNKQMALLMTHDTDVLRLSANKEIVGNILKGLIRRKSEYWSLVQNGLTAKGKSVIDDPLFGFNAWAKVESALGLKSQFLLSTSTAGLIKSDLNDCKSSLSYRTADSVWQVFRELSSQGWEFGLHAPIYAKTSLDYFIWAKKLLEDKLGTTIRGLRHHYWALDWQKPHLTFRKHVNAGFRYDMSVAWRDLPGFRSATCFPYSPYDPISERAFNFIELPTALLEKHFMGAHVKLSNPFELVQQLTSDIRQQSGMLVADWHTETVCNKWEYLGFLDGFYSVIAPLAQESSVWKTYPWQLAKYWHERSKNISFADNSTLLDQISVAV